MPVVGHTEQKAIFIDAWQSARLHHAWLLTGPKGIGKATFAHAAARMLLAGGNGIELEGISGHSAISLLAAGSHPDFRLVERTVNDRGGLRAEIGVDQIRELQNLVATTATFGGWRIAIIDAADELNRSAANAFLKNLEEPPEKTIFFLISHNPSRLLPTIRSRCRALRFKPLTEPETVAVMRAEFAEADASEIATLAVLSQGSPGAALRFAGLDVDRLKQSLDRLADAGKAAGGRDCLVLSRSLAGKVSQLRYEAFVELVPTFIAAKARSREGASLAHAIALWEKAHALAAEALPLAYDPQAVVYELAGLVSELGKN